MKKTILLALFATTLINGANLELCKNSVDKQLEYFLIATAKYKSGIFPKFELKMEREYIFQQIGYCDGLLPKSSMKHNMDRIKRINKQLKKYGGE